VGSFQCKCDSGYFGVLCEMTNIVRCETNSTDSDRLGTSCIPLDKHRL
jgi:hypothetical protein